MGNDNITNIRHALNADVILDRLKYALKIKNDVELANELGVSKATFSSWRKRDALDFKTIIEYAGEKNIDLNYLILGKIDEFVTDRITRANSINENLLEIIKVSKNNQFIGESEKENTGISLFKLMSKYVGFSSITTENKLQDELRTIETKLNKDIDDNLKKIELILKNTDNNAG